MISPIKSLAAGAVLAALLGGTGAAFAQAPPGWGPYPYHWERAWDRGYYDQRHVVVGTVIGFSPYRLQVRHANGSVQTIDLKNGTVIRPLGATPQPGQRVAALGQWSYGTFVAGRIVLKY